LIFIFEVPTDILCGILLKYNNQKPVKIKDKYTFVDTEMIPDWMKDELEAKHYIKYALAIYSWPIHLYIHKIKIFPDLFFYNTNFSNIFPLTSKKKTTNDSAIIEGSKMFHLDYRSFKHLAKLEDRDVIYANFHNEINFVPFSILADRDKKMIVITIRGSLSLE
jgi:sn1-specific diacylglycerol lipase